MVKLLRKDKVQLLFHFRKNKKPQNVLGIGLGLHQRGQIFILVLENLQHLMQVLFLICQGLWRRGFRFIFMQLKLIDKLVNLLKGQAIRGLKEIFELLIDLKLMVDLFVQLINIS